MPGPRALAARARKEVAEGAPLVPMEVAERIASGEHPIRVLREWRDMTQMHLSFRTNLGQGYISDLESGRRRRNGRGIARDRQRIAGPA